MELVGQTAVVTGASRGIGKAVASTLVERGANVALWSRREEGVAAAADEVGAVGAGRVASRAVEVRDRDEVEEAVAEAAAELGPISLLVNNAGTAGPAGVDWEANPEEWWECVETTLRGSFLCARSVLPGMLERGQGRIVEMASLTGTNVFPLLNATSVAKAALIRHAENLAAATAGTGVTVFALHPGTVDTALLASYRSNPQMAAFLDGLPEDGYTPTEIASQAVARIASGEFDCLSGCFIDVTRDLDTLAADDDQPAPDRLRLRLNP